MEEEEAGGGGLFLLLWSSLHSLGDTGEEIINEQLISASNKATIISKGYSLIIFIFYLHGERIPRKYTTCAEKGPFQYVESQGYGLISNREKKMA